MNVSTFWDQYTYNIKKTHRHKVAYAVDEYKQFGYNTIDSFTHDADKMFWYVLGYDHDEVVRKHRRISEHHIENNKKKNIKSMFIDIHCSGDKPDKQTPFRDYFYGNKQLRDTKGLEKFAKEHNFGEKVAIQTLTKEVDKITGSFIEFIKFGVGVLKHLRFRH